MKRVILGSGSPRRKELLAGLNVDFEVDTRNDFKESVDASLSPGDVPVKMAEGKSHGFHRPLLEDEVLVTADTVVIIDGKVLGKPHSWEDAVKMLRLLSGKTHEVVTGVTVRDSSREMTFSDSTLVTFAPMTDSDIFYYVDTYRPYDKAGAYAIQEWIGYAFITEIRGSFYNVMGLPVHRVFEVLSEFGVRAS